MTAMYLDLLKRTKGMRHIELFVGEFIFSYWMSNKRSNVQGI